MIFDLSDEELVEHIWQKYKGSDEVIEAWRREARKDLDFYNGHQWDEDDLIALDEQDRPAVTFNRVAKVIDAVSGSEVVNRQEATYLPRTLDDAAQTEVWNAATKWVRDLTDAEDEESDAFRETLITGMGWTETSVHYEDEPDGEIRIERTDPLEMRWDTTSTQRNLTEKGWLCRERWVREDEIKARWPGRELIPEERDMRGLDQPHDADDPDYDERQYFSYNPREKEFKVLQYQWFELKPFPRGVNPQGELEEGLDGITQYRKVYYQAFVAARTLLEKQKMPISRFSYECITGKRDKRGGATLWYGIMRGMRDPQLWANKFFSQILHIYNKNPKGVTFWETGVFADARKAAEDINRADGMVEVQAGGLGRIKHETGFQIPANVDRLMQYAIQAIPDVSGVSPEFLGVADREQAGVVEFQRARQSLGILSIMFDSLRRYRKRHGRLLLDFINRYISDGRMMRILGPEGQTFLPLARAGNIRYDVIVDDAPNSPNSKTEAWVAMQQNLPILLNAGFPPIPEIIDYMPLPVSMATKWKQAHQANTQMVQELQGQVQKLERENLILTAKREERVDANKTKQVREVLSDDREREKMEIEKFEAATNRMRVEEGE